MCGHVLRKGPQEHPALSLRSNNTTLPLCANRHCRYSLPSASYALTSSPRACATASRDPRRGHRPSSHKSTGCTSCGYASAEGQACPSPRQRASPAEDPACSQRRAQPRPGAHLRSACGATPPWRHRYGRDRSSPPRRSSPAPFMCLQTRGQREKTLITDTLEIERSPSHATSKQ